MEVASHKAGGTAARALTITWACAAAVLALSALATQARADLPTACGFAPALVTGAALTGCAAGADAPAQHQDPATADDADQTPDAAGAEPFDDDPGAAEEDIPSGDAAGDDGDAPFAGDDDASFGDLPAASAIQRLSLKVSRRHHRFSGRLVHACGDERLVLLFRRAVRGDVVIATVKVDQSGRFMLSRRVARGTYYAAAQTQASDGAFCAAVRSRRTRIG